VTLERSQRVTIVAPVVGDLPAMVQDDDDQVVTLVITIPADQRLERLRDAGRASLEYTTPTGLHRVTGDVVGEPGRPEVVRLRRDDRGRTVQRRDNVRVEAVVPVAVSVVDEPERAGESTTVNLSAGGVLPRGARTRRAGRHRRAEGDPHRHHQPQRRESPPALHP
jgi:hypothetical protein